MNNQITIFSNPNFGEIRTAGTAEEPLFCLADVCKVLELQVTPTKNRLNPKGVNSINTPTNGGKQSMIFISEQNLYKVIMRSDKPQAESFQDWVCGEVLPTIRKTGGFIVADKNMTDEEIMAKAVLVAQTTIRQRDERIKSLAMENENQRLLIEQMKKGNDYLNTILQSRETVTSTQIAQDYGMSAKAFNKILKEMRIQHKVAGQWILYSPYIGKGYVQSKTFPIIHADGMRDTKMNTEWTQRGRVFLYDALKEVGVLPKIEQQYL